MINEPKVDIHSRVILRKCEFGPGENNPTWGSKYACEGTVILIDNGYSLPIRVSWDNGLTNSYDHRHLIRIKDGKKDPNLSFKLNKVREEPK